MTDVFVSYKRGDAAKVRKLVAALRQVGLDTWWDEDIPPSAPWEATIETELARAKTVIVCWSPDAVASDNVRSEARVAREDGRLIQVFLRPCQPPLFFGEKQALDLSKWRGNADDVQVSKLAESVRKVAAGERVEGGERLKPHRRWFERRVHLALAVLIVLAGSMAGWWLLAPAKAQGPETVAVLPFRALNPADTNLVDAIWDDTRGAISKNPNLRVLGREAMTALAKQDLAPADYRKKVGADYLLDGSVQHVGEQVRMKLSLTRTSDASEVWSDEIGGKLDDVFAFQQQVAREVEGRIRGRVAPGGGVKAQNIATTGEVYAIYAEARANIRKRDRDSGLAAIALLHKAVTLDPNYAPAWSSLGQVTGMPYGKRPDEGVDQQQARAVSYLQRALQLAPNLAHAHAALAMVQDFPPELEGELLKAVQLDPNDPEAWTWLGHFYSNQNRMKEALAAQTRAVDIEPLFYTARVNRIGALAALNDTRGIEEEIRRIAAAGDPLLLAKVQAMTAGALGHPGDQARLLLQLRAAHPEEASYAELRLGDPLMQLGFVDEALVAWHVDPAVAADFRGIPPPPRVFKEYPRPVDLWLDGSSPASFGRSLPKHGRLNEYVGYYRAAFKGNDDVAKVFQNLPGRLVGIAPVLAADLRASGDSADADALLQNVQAFLLRQLRNGPAEPGLLADLAAVRAAQGRGDEAIGLLGRAVAGGWLPDRTYRATDLNDEPFYAALVNRPDFQAVRQRILARIADERRKVPLPLLAQAFPVKRQQVAA